MSSEEDHPDQTSGIRLGRLADGPGRGMRLLEVRISTELAFGIVVDRGLDLGAASIRGGNPAYQARRANAGPS